MVSEGARPWGRGRSGDFHLGSGDNLGFGPRGPGMETPVNGSSGRKARTFI